MIARACVALWLAQAVTSHANEAPDVASGSQRGAWSAGMDAMSVAIPESLEPAESTQPAATQGAQRGEFLAVPIPRVDPALGTGLVGAAAWIFRLDPSDSVSPPSILGAGALWMDGGSRGGGLGGKLYLREDRLRFMAGAVYADLRYDLGVQTGSSTAMLALPLSQEAYGGLAHAQLRVGQHLYLGMRAQFGQLATSLRSADEPDLPESIADQLGQAKTVNSLGPTFALDTRDSAYYPRHGMALDAGIDLYSDSLGSDVSLDRYEVNYRQYKALRNRDVFAWQAYACATDGDVPFYLQCQVGQNSLLRGYSFGEYRGNTMAAAQAEYRWQFRPRWIAAAFAGVAQVAPEFGDFAMSENLYAGGIGLRFVVEPKNGVTLRVDYAVGKDEDAIYVSVGEAF